LSWEPARDEPGRLQSFDVVWDTENGGWFHLYPEQELPPDDGLHWSGPYKTWNARCAGCHATGYEKNYDAATRTYASTQAEIGVGCEACHGPGQAHLDWAEDTTHEPPAGYGFSQPFATTEATIQQCATCHSRREAHTDASPRPGTPYHDAYGLALLRPGAYHADGQILDEVYVYGSFLQSKMYAAGVGCLDCHDAHSAMRVADGNAVCTQCHSPAGNPRFETLTPAEYDAPEHHFHEPGTEGAQCIACHAPERVYMGNDWRADHSFRVPRPDLSAATGAPDACTTCPHRPRRCPGRRPRSPARVPDSDARGPHTV
jgi:Doubled CXXCH motif (Paired_CXXCH_1).